MQAAPNKCNTYGGYVVNIAGKFNNREAAARDGRCATALLLGRQDRQWVGKGKFTNQDLTLELLEIWLLSAGLFATLRTKFDRGAFNG